MEFEYLNLKSIVWRLCLLDIKRPYQIYIELGSNKEKKFKGAKKLKLNISYTPTKIDVYYEM